MERKLATIRKIEKVIKHPNADSLDLLIIDGWQVVSRLGEFNKGDFCIYCEIDSIMPQKPEFEFLRPRNFRIKTTKLRGEISQGIAFPMSILPPSIMLGTDDLGMSFIDCSNITELGDIRTITSGTDVTDILEVIKYEAPIPACLSGIMKGDFPSFIQRTDEERIQNLTEKYKDFVGKHVYISEKMDGSSSTFYIKDGQFGVCSRNLELIESEINTFWSFARKNELKSKMIKLNRNIALQGEILGPGIQKNKYNLSVHDIYFFTGFDIDSYKRLSFNELRSVLIEIDLNIVPIIEEDFILPKNHNVIINFADGKSILNNKINREGIVIRGINDNFSFKVISNIFLLKNKE